jgi:serine/threonine-protein kinase
MSKGAEDSGDSTTLHSGPHPVPSLEGQLSLPVIALEGEFELGETLGTGGMGQVVSAKQKALQRSVAIKFLKRDEDDASHLLREAIATGRLEHPNIVPVHVLAKTPDGAAFFTMKRVEGTPWSEALGKRSLVENLEILQRVSDAIAFAHSRGVIHRDVKPANVMLGAFGEVYLVDWGLAAAMSADSVLPKVTEAGLAGTPAYFAPEAARADGRLGPWTDVFLLGSTLYEVLFGRPPWGAPTLAQTVAMAASGKAPLFDGIAPAELVSICRRAMQTEPGERYESARAFKDALTGYLRHHDALELHERTAAKLDELERAMSQPGAVPVERLFTECRFGFEQVRHAWPDFEPARASLRRTLVSMVKFELSRQAPRSARALLAEIAHPPAELVLQVETAERAEADKAARLVALEQRARESSPDAVRGPKSLYTKAIALLIITSSTVTQAILWLDLYRYTTRDGVFFSAAFVINGFVYTAWLRRQREANQLQHRVALALIGISVLSVLGWVVAWLGDVRFETAMVLYYVLHSTGWWTASVVVEGRGVAVAVGFAVAAVLGAIFPAYVCASGIAVGVSFWQLSRLLRDSPVAPLQ